MTRYQRAKRLHTWICAVIAMSVYGLIFVIYGIADWIAG